MKIKKRRRDGVIQTYNIKPKPKKTIKTIYGDAEYSHTEQDKEFYKNNSKYSFANNYAVIHEGNQHHIYKIKKQATTLGKKISEKQYYHYLEVLPPLLMGTQDIIDFLIRMDKNPELINTIEQEAKGAFMQGEGFDNHDIYIRTKNKEYYKLGTTKHKWNTEMFRYNNWRTMTPEEIKKYNFRLH